MVKVSTPDGNNSLSVSVADSSVSVSLSSQNKSITYSMTNSEAEYYSNLSKQLADNADESAILAKQYSEIAQVCSKSLQTNWDEDDSNSQAYIQNKPNVALKSDINTINSGLNTKVDKIDGKNLSTNDLTNTLKSNYDTAYTLANNASNKDLSNLSDAGNAKFNTITTSLATKAGTDFSNISLATALANLGLLTANDSIIKIPQKLSNGTVRTYIIQIGQSGILTNETSVSVTFPVAFPTNCLCVVSGTYTASGAPDRMMQLYSYTLSGATFYSNAFSTAVGSTYAQYIAMGY